MLPANNQSRPSSPPVSNLIVLRNRYVLLHAERPVNVQRVLVQSQHEHNQHEQRVEHGEVEDGHVAQLLQSLRRFGLVGGERDKQLEVVANWLTYFIGLLDKGDVLLDAEGPLDEDPILVEGEEEDNEDKEGIEQVEEKGHVVLQLQQAAGQSGLVFQEKKLVPTRN